MNTDSAQSMSATEVHGEKFVIHGRVSTRHYWIRNIISMPFIYSVLIPVFLLDLVVSLYQAVCFPLYRIPKIRRRDYIQYNRGKMESLGLIDKAHCHYCSYVNGAIAYAAKVAGQTEKIWCPLRHAAENKFVELPHQKSFVSGDQKSELEEYYQSLEQEMDQKA